MSQFLEIIEKRQNEIGLMPVFHNTDAYSFRSILLSKSFDLSLCPVFNKKLTYAFYGKPSYRKHQDSSTSNSSKFPICFILNTENLPVPFKVFPFDSGLFYKNKKFREKLLSSKNETRRL